MEAIKILMNEHKIILKTLNNWLVRLPTFSSKDVADGKRVIEFIQIYVDQYHHGKEEKILFKWMLEQRPELEYGPVACMLKEHDQGRMIVHNISILLDDFEKNPQDFKTGELICAYFREFAELLEQHIGKEDNVLYGFANDINDNTGTGDESMLPLMSEVNLKLADKAHEFEQLSF